MFQYGQLSNAIFFVEHQHDDGSWARMELERSPHDPAEVDPEKDWSRGHVYVCKTCEERVRISVAEGDQPVR